MDQWIITLIASLIAIGTLCVSQPQKPYWQTVTILLIILSGIVSSITQYAENDYRKVVAARIMKQVYGETHKFSYDISQMIVYSSDGWIPQNADEFYSQKTVDTICTHLDLDKDAPVVPRIPWWIWVEGETKTFEEAIDRITFYNSEYIDENIYNSLTKLEEASVMQFWMRFSIIDTIDKRPKKTLCNGTQEDMLKTLLELKKIDAYFKNNQSLINNMYMEPWHNLDGYKNVFGRDRLDFEKLSKDTDQPAGNAKKLP
jgi:hypothetical protein